MKNITYLTLVALTCSCSSQVDDSLIECQNSMTPHNGFFIDAVDTILHVDASEALSVAKMLNAKSRSEKEVESVQAVNNEIGDIAYYVINYKNDNGFVIVSGCKDIQPILAYSDEGHFTVNEANECGANLWMSELDVSLSNPDSISVEDKRRSHILWSEYIKKQKEIVRSSAQSRMFYDDEYEQEIIENQIQEWKNNGYNVYTVADYYENRNYLPALTTDMEQRLYTLYNEDFDLMKYEYPRNYNYVITKSSNETHDDFVLTNATWDQIFPYNLEVPYYEDGYEGLLAHHVKLGCTAVALGLILKCDGNVPGYDFSKMLDKDPGNNTVLERFLYDVGCNIGIDYANKKTGATIGDVERALTNYGYTYKVISHSFAPVRSALRAGQLVYMRGEDKYSTGGHAWVCDGVVYSTSSSEVRIMVLNYQPGDTIFGPFMEDRSASSTSSTQYLHMNWGFGGDCNGFFGDNILINTSKYNDVSDNHQFSIDRKDIINIKYNK